MTTITKTIADPDFVNWVKAGLVLQFTKEGIEDLVSTVTNQFHQTITASLPAGTACTACSTENVLPCPTNRLCGKICKYHKTIKPKHCPSCEKFRNEVFKTHRFKDKNRFGGPSWANTDATQWSTNSWELAKCYMARDGYRHVTSIKETDLSGLLSVIINHTDFQAVLAVNLTLQTNMFCKARQIRNDILHSPTQRVTDADLKKYIDTMVTLLLDPVKLAKDAKAQNAIIKLKKVENGSIIDEDITHVLSEVGKTIETLKFDMREEAKTQREEEIECIQDEVKKQDDIIKRTVKQETDCIKSEGQHQKDIVNEAGQEETDSIKAEGQEQKDAIREETAIAMDSLQKTICDTGGYNSKIQYENMKSDLKKKLIKIYDARYLATPLSPLNLEVDVKIAEVYVNPHIQKESVDKKDKEDYPADKKDIIKSYKDIFEKDRIGHYSELCENIYICGDAGSGKSSLCKNMVSTWCDVRSSTNLLGQSESNAEDHAKNAKLPSVYTRQCSVLQENEVEMEKFSFLFIISLRDCTSEESVEEMIKSLLPKKYHAIIAEVLDDEEEQCLIILDGLDEWAPPKQHKANPFITKGLPNREVWSKCSIITTTRPWKLAHLGLRSSEVDKQVNILGLDSQSSYELIRRVVALLNMKYDKNKSTDDFVKLLEEKKMQKMMNVPVVLKQLVCLWHDGKSIGESQCEIYSGMLDLLFEMAESRLNTIDSYNKILHQTAPSPKPKFLPRCFTNNKKCQHHIVLLLALGKLAYFTIFNENESSSLVFEKSVARYHGMSQAEMEVCLRTGILSQNRLNDKCTEKNVKVSFLHKTFQEFLAALYIALPHESTEDSVSHIVRTCDSVFNILEMSKVFVFVAGMSPTTICKISEQLVASADKSIQSYRRGVPRDDFLWIGSNRNGLFLQELIHDCWKEGELNGHVAIRLHLREVIIDKEDNTWEPEVDKYSVNINNVEASSYTVRNKRCVTDMCSLEFKMLYLSGKDKKDEIPFDIFQLVQNSGSSLTVLCFNLLSMTSLTNENFTRMLQSLSCLLSVRFEKVTLTHEQYNILTYFLSQREQTQLNDTKIVKEKLRIPELSVEMKDSLKSKSGGGDTSDASIRNVDQEAIQDLSQQTPIKVLNTCDDECSSDSDAETQSCTISQYNRLEWSSPPSTCVACRRLVKKFQFLTQTGS